MLCLAEQKDDRSLLIDALYSNGVTQFYRGQFAEALAHLERGILLADAEQQRSLFSANLNPVANSVMGCHCIAALSLSCLGQSRRSLERIPDLLARGRELAHPTSKALAHFTVALIYLLNRSKAET